MGHLARAWTCPTTPASRRDLRGTKVAPGQAIGTSLHSGCLRLGNGPTGSRGLAVPMAGQG